MDNMYIPPVPPNLAEETVQIISLCQEALKLNFPRGDYKELVHLTLVYLNAAPPKFNLLRPGALHKARWMAKLIYSLKIVLLSDQIKELPTGTILGKGQLPKILEFTKFVVYCYVPWLACPLPAAAPINDIKLISVIDNYKQHNLTISNSALKALKNHM